MSRPPDLTGLVPPWALVGVELTGGRGNAVGFAADGTIAACGTARDAIAALPARAEIVDGGGAIVCPGFVDAHVHVRAAASARLATDVSRAATPAEILAAVRGARQAGRWITLAGADLARGCVPDRAALDEAAGGAPVRIRDRSGHGWAFNTAGLEALGIEDAPGLVPDHDGWVGRRLGRLTPDEELTGAVASWSRELARMGVAAVCDATATNDASRIASLLRWRAGGALLQEISYLSSPVAAGRGPRHAGIKFADASDARLPAALRSGARVAVHCVEPAETAAVLGLAAAVPERGALRIEHAAFVPPDWIGDVKRLGATVVTHPAFIRAHGDRYLADPLLEPHDWLYRLGSWTRAGVALAFGSDAPFGPADPLAALRAALDRRTASGARIGPGEALGLDAALHALTTAAAACSGLDRFGYGTIRRGGPGSVVVLGPGLELVASVIGGRVVD
jgi:predicted amidohydrolase YtcJ